MIDKPTPMLLTDADVGELLRCDVATIRNLHRLRRLVGFQIGRELRWRSCDVAKFVDKLDKDDE